MKEALLALDHIRLNFSEGGLFFLNVTIAFVMFGVALNIKLSEFRDVFKKPKSFITGLVSQFILLPAGTFLLVLILNPTPSVALGMILVAACPGGNVSNFMTSLAKGNIALSVSMTAFSTMIAMVMTPANFAFWGDLYINMYEKTGAELLRPIEIDFWQVVQTVFILLGIPVALGVFFAKRFPRLTEKIKKPAKQISFIIFILFVIILLSANFSNFMKAIHLIFFIVLLHNGLALAIGFVFSTIMRRPRMDRRAITIETGIQNSGLALVLMFNPKIFPPDLELGGMAVVAAWWGVWHIVSGLILSSIWARKPLEA
ncbi:MAG: bile acid:sodium symporter family protein [Prolixibacteraceae bacterium]|jgi:BASS family bile acid:Na+ symporter|nr:bile acid:sodium symporter family protein [Prolixibacteraceae bacterium]NLS98496.1 bile acid:sodium symporter family protein [Bacteroidales bacterium]OQB78214.1 MAG: Sodium Bile acid symporter family protein [Bacteroidetes bacterium ADurb.Bin123]HNZ69418.1 bile acid:sodium symporter family protein [Prolixibacteraceae bacterium]HOC86567.1 bile acid:sodium symporter family protein [Prolixibacteraceae bacterium]